MSSRDAWTDRRIGSGRNITIGQSHSVGDKIVRLGRRSPVASTCPGRVHRHSAFLCFLSIFGAFTIQWHALGREEQAKYYELARRERQLHMQLYPDWSSRANTQRGKKRKRKQETTDGGTAFHSVDERPSPSSPIPVTPTVLSHPASWFSWTASLRRDVVSRSRRGHMSRSAERLVWMRYSHRLIKKMRSINEGLSPETLAAHSSPSPSPADIAAPILSRESSIALNSAPNGPSDIVTQSWLKGYEVVDIQYIIYTSIFVYFIFIAFIYLIWNAILRERSSRKSFEGCPGLKLPFCSECERERACSTSSQYLSTWVIALQGE